MNCGLVFLGGKQSSTQRPDTLRVWWCQDLAVEFLFQEESDAGIVGDATGENNFALGVGNAVDHPGDAANDAYMQPAGNLPRVLTFGD